MSQNPLQNHNIVEVNPVSSFLLCFKVHFNIIPYVSWSWKWILFRFPVVLLDLSLAPMRATFPARLLVVKCHHPTATSWTGDLSKLFMVTVFAKFSVRSAFDIMNTSHLS